MAKAKAPSKYKSKASKPRIQNLESLGKFRESSVARLEALVFAGNPTVSILNEGDPLPCRGSNSTASFRSCIDYVLREADIVLEVLDARDPLQSRSCEIERKVVDSGKMLILLLNKIDLVPKSAVEAWQKYLQLETGFRCMPFKSARVTTTSRTPVHASESFSHVNSSEMESAHLVIGATELLSHIKYKSLSASQRIISSIKVGVLGKPNVGKSSIIASLCRNNAVVRVGGEAGVTRKTQTVQLDKKVHLIDCPGVIPRGAEETDDNVLSSAMKVTAVKEPAEVVQALLSKYSQQQIEEWFHCPSGIHTVDEFLFHIAQARGKFKPGGGPDFDAAARCVITDWTSGKIRHFTLPPELLAAQEKSEDFNTGIVVGAVRRPAIVIPDF